MNRVFLYLTSAAALPLLADASLKGAALLVLAGAVALLMRRSSAAARHMVWLAAVVALLLVPVLAVVLPGWRVLPQWAVVEAHAAPPAAEHRPHEAYRPFEPYTPAPHAAPDTLPAPASIAPLEPLPPTVASVPAPLPPAAAPPVAAPAHPATSWLLPLWLTGCALLLLRLAAAHFLLRRNTRRCEPASGPLAAAFAAAQQESSLRQPVRLLMDNARSIPVVWGVFRPTLLLPAEAVTWDAAQLRSVLLHELAHLRRRDPLVQFLTQIACALHWFNPLVWLAAWRLHVERERACDDMVLASGVRPSTYAGHLLHIATQLSPARWTQACGLAMARKSSLEGRLTAVLSDKLNRRRLTRALTAAAILLSAAIAVPIAMLRAAEEKSADSKSPGSSEVAKEIDWRKVFCAEFGPGCWQLHQLEPFDAAQLHQIAKTPAAEFQRLDQTPDWPHNIGNLKALILKAAAARNPDFRYLLENETLVKDEKYGWGSALKAYDYMVNGNEKALEALLPAEPEYAWRSGDALAHIDEWDRSLAWMQKHAGGDGEGYELWKEFWLTRAYLFTEHYKAYFKEHPDCGGRSPEWFVEMSGKPYRGSEIGKENEAQLDWGEPVNGLRGALVIRPTAPGAEPGIYLAVQNVTEAALRFSDSMAAKDLRKLYLSDSSGILMALTSSKPTQTDVVLQPREVAFLRQFDPVASGEQSVEPAMIEGLRKDSLQTWRAVLNIENAQEGAWTGKLTTGETRCATTEGPQPKSKEGRALFKVWQDSARLNGDIPGGLVSLLHDKVKEFIRNNEPDASGAPYAAKMKPLEPRFGELRDWKPADVVALMDDIAAASTIPLETTLDHLTRNTLRHGQPLPAALEKSDWGQPLESGLRMAYLLEPRAAEYHLGTEVKARILLHNAGKEPVAFIAGGFHQPGHKAKLADGSELKLDATDWLTRSVPQAWRLAPGEYVELHTPGLGIGAQNKDRDDWSNVRAGSWILCGDGSEVTFLPGGIMLSGADSKLDGEPRPWWPEFITDRLNREAPVPADTKEREYLLYRVVRDLFGTAPTTTEGDAFAADKSPDALKNLAALLTKHAYGKQSQGMIQPGETKFRVLPPDPDAAKRVRVASNPGYYNLSDTLKFSVTRLAEGNRVITEASLIHFQQGKDDAITKVELPDGYNTWAAAMEPGTPVLWIKQKDLTRRYDFTDPAQIKETRPDGDVPTRVLEAMQPILAAPDESSAPKDNPPPAATPEKKTATVAPQPRHEYAQSLFKSWQANARSDGKIPGALVGLLAGKVDEFIKGYTGAGQDAVNLKALRPKLDATRDWTPAEAVALLDEIAAINYAPLGWAEMPMKFDGFRDIKAGQPLPKGLEGAAWGTPAENGLRAAWLLEPRAEQYAHGTVLKARVLFHNAGKAPVVFQTETWHQYDGHKALDAKGAEISVKATRFSGITPMATFRLAPGEYCEVTGHGLAIGAGEYKEEFSTGAAGAIIEAKEGDTVTLSHTVDASYGGWTRPDDPKDPAELRKKQIAERIAREAPLPYAAADRELLIRRVTLDLTGVAPTPEEIAAFTADKSPDALANLTARLQNQPAVKPWSGQLPTSETKFRVLPADPDATDKPKTVAVKLSPESLIGAWRGTVNGEKLMLSFHRPPAEKDVQCDIYFGEATIGVPASFAIAEDGGSAAVVQQSAGGGMKFGTLIPDEAGKLKLELYGRQQGQQETMLTRDAEPPVSNERKPSTQPKSGAKLDRAQLEGTWEGEKDGATVEVEFQWLSEHQQVRWEVKRPGSSIGAQMSVVMAPDGNSADFIFRKGLDFEATQGRVTPGEGGTLHLEIIPNPNVSDPGYPAVKGLVLKRNPDGTVPKTSEAGAVR